MTRPTLQATAASTAATDTVRGVACILLVAYHVVGPDRYSGMRVGDTSVYRTVIADGPLLVRMPLFTFLSGFVYAYRPVRHDFARSFIWGKVRRLLIPLVVAGTAFALLQAAVPASNTSLPLHDLWRIYIWPFAHYWYLHALFLVFLVMVVLDGLHILDRASNWLVAMLIAIVLFFLAPHAPSIFGVAYAMYLLPFFLWGVGLHSFGGAIRDNQRIRAGTLVVGAGAIVINVFVAASWIHVSHGRFTPVGLVIGLLATAAISTMRISVPLLAHLGSYSYAIFLYHIFGTAGARIAITKVISAPAVVFITSLGAGVLFPVALYEIASRNRWSKLVLLGESPHRRRRIPVTDSYLIKPSSGTVA